MKAIFFGHSHLGPILHAWEDAALRPKLNYNASFAFVNEGVKWLTPPATIVDGACIPNPAVMNLMQNHGAFTPGQRSIVFALGGNEHTILALLTQGTHLNFVMPGESVDVEADETIVPFEAIRQAILQRSEVSMALTTLVKGITAHPTLCIESPPPPQSNEWLTENLDKYFVAKMTKGDLMVARPSVRRKMWQVRSMLWENYCNDVGMPFVKVPDRLMENGFLKPEYLGNATHANPSFGAEMMKEVDTALASLTGH